MINVFILYRIWFSALGEELLFRGILQRFLTDKFNYPVGIGITSVIFGVVHFPFGYIFMGLATIAGVLYGYVFYRTTRIEYATGVHVLVNVARTLL